MALIAGGVRMRIFATARHTADSKRHCLLDRHISSPYSPYNAILLLCHIHCHCRPCAYRVVTIIATIIVVVGFDSLLITQRHRRELHVVRFLVTEKVAACMIVLPVAFLLPICVIRQF